MTSRLSYASSPESDLELSPAPALSGALGVPSRLKSSSDPSIATQDDIAAPPPYSTIAQQLANHIKRKYIYNAPVIVSNPRVLRRHRKEEGNV